MHTADIQAELKKRGLTQKKVADDLGIKPMAVSDVINKNRISIRIMRHVAKLIGRDHREVFPEYFLKPPKRSHSQVHC